MPEKQWSSLRRECREKIGCEGCLPCVDESQSEDEYLSSPDSRQQHSPEINRNPPSESEYILPPKMEVIHELGREPMPHSRASDRHLGDIDGPELENPLGVASACASSPRERPDRDRGRH